MVLVKWVIVYLYSILIIKQIVDKSNLNSNLLPNILYLLFTIYNIYIDIYIYISEFGFSIDI